MKSIRTNSTVRTIIIAMTLLGWFVLSNHCALGRMGHRVEVRKEHSCCHNGAPKPADEPADRAPGTQCCKSLHAVVPDGVKIAELPVLFAAAFIARVVAAEVVAEAARVLTSDTGPPPRAASFSELVLQRSLRSHAPPFLA